MPRCIRYALTSGAIAALAWAWWPAAPGGLATATRRLDVTVTVVLLAGLPRLVRRFFGPAGRGRTVQAVRAGGYLVVVAVVLVKAAVGRFGYTRLDGVSRLAGAWTGEIVFLAVLTAYLAGILAVTARRPPIRPSALVIGTGAGLVAGVLLYALPPVGGLLHVTGGWPVHVYGAARVLAMLTVLAAGVAAGVTAARRASGRGGKLSQADIRARQGVATGLCAGAAAALVVCVLGIGTAVFVPQAVGRLRWALSGPHLAPTGVYAFGISLTETAAGHLLVLVFFPVLGAGLGAWGGLCAAGRPGQLPDEGGGGGGHGPPAPLPPPPGGGQHLDNDRLPAILSGGYLVDLPAVPGLPATADGEDPARSRPVKAPVGPPRLRRAISRGDDARVGMPASGGRVYDRRAGPLGRTPARPLLPDDLTVIEDLAAPDTAGFGALHRAGQASLAQRAGPAARLGQL